MKARRQRKRYVYVIEYERSQQRTKRDKPTSQQGEEENQCLFTGEEQSCGVR